MVDRLSVMCEKTQNKGTEAAVLAVKNWGNKFGYPYKVISNTGLAFRADFIKQLLTLDVKHKPSSAYHPQSNNLTKRAIQSVKNCLRKSSSRFTKMHLDEITFAINLTASHEGTGSANKHFRSVQI